MAAVTTSLVLKVNRSEPQLIKPAKPTPHEFKLLSDVDDQEGLRFQVPIMQFYRSNPRMHMDPVHVIKEAIARTLVFYYPLAGRVREAGHNRKLMVECNGEGILFIEGDADVRLEDFADALPAASSAWLEELLFDVNPSSATSKSTGVLNSPLLLIQVTRLKCGGFVFGLQMNHTMCDAQGMVQFMEAVGEMARGASSPSIPPVWERHILNATDPPRITCTHPEYDQLVPEVPDTNPTATVPHNLNLLRRAFFFGPSEISAIRKLVPPHLAQSSTSFEILTAFIWKCHTIAVQPPHPSDVMRLMCTVNARGKVKNNLLELPTGYYGNAFATPAALATAGDLCLNPLGYALELVRKAKGRVTGEYMHSIASLLASKGRPHVTAVRSLVVSDVRRAGFQEVDFGWGKAIYGGVARGGVGVVPGLISFYNAFTNQKGETGTVLVIALPPPAMDRFVNEIRSVTCMLNAAHPPA